MMYFRNKNNLFNIIFFYFIIAISSAFIFLFFTNTYYLGILQERTEDQYEDRLESLSNELQNIYDEIQFSTAAFILEGDLQAVLTTNEVHVNRDYTTLLGSVETLAAYRITKTFIHSILAISTKDDIVLSSYGTGQINEYFNKVLVYEDYTADFWLEQSFDGDNYELLAPNYVTYASRQDPIKVIPLVQYVVDQYRLTVPLIINIDESYISNQLNATKLSENSIIFHYNKDMMISRSNSNAGLTLTTKELIQLADSYVEDQTNLYNFNDEKYIVVTHQSNRSGNKLCAITPYSDLRAESMSILLLPVILFFVGITIVTILSLLFSRKIYRPIHNAALHLRENYSLEGDLAQKNDLDFLSQSVQLVVSDLIKLKEDISLAIPYVCERYLLSLFDDNEILREEEVTEFLAQYDFSFPYNTFVVVQSILNFQEGFFETHSKTEYNAICQGNLIIANEAFSYVENQYIFSPAVNQICVILNLPDNYDKSTITDSIMKYHESLNIDDDMMIVHSGVGRLYEGLNGLKLSYTEALQAQSQITYLTTSMIRLFTQADDTVFSSYYSIDEENHLINFLLQGDIAKATSHYDTIISKNMVKKIGTHAMKELYLQLYNTAIRVINRRQHNIYDLLGDQYINISSHVGDLHIDDLYKYVKKVFVETTSLSNKSNALTDMSNLKQYLDANYTEEIYLDAIAEHFGKSANYMSKYIKKTLGVPFQDYIASLRINKAKELLLSTKKSIVDIAGEVGFNSRHPFIRKFKILEGVTPTEYRKLHK